MGIILKNSKQVFDELIGSSYFDTIFKNSIRDYYIYGFKSYHQFSGSDQTARKRWNVFSKVWGEKWYFEQRKNGRNQITLKTAPAGSENPLSDLYFMHNLSKIGDYLNYLLDMDSRAALRGGIKKLPVALEELETIAGNTGIKSLKEEDETEYSIISNWFDKLNGRAGKTDDLPVRINRQLYIWSPATRIFSKNMNNKYSNLKERTDFLYNLGIIGDLRDDPEERNKWLEKQWRQYSPTLRRYFTGNAPGDHYWYRSPQTMDKIIKEICKDDDGIHNFRAFCDFFSQYYPLGEFGIMLSKRCGRKSTQYDGDIFRFKHNYLQKTLYDYNLIDLLGAIEKRYLCLILYSHGTNMKSYEEIILPLEIRISVTNGREYVMYYHVTERKIKALRLEFIDKIIAYTSIKSIYKIQYRIYKTGKKKKRKCIGKTEIILDREDIAKQLKTALEMLPFIWGAEVGECEVTNNWRDKLISIRLPVTFHFEKEKYIQNRLEKEKRATQNSGDILIFPTKELRTWIRSFYQRLDIDEDTKIGDFLISADVDAMWKIYHTQFLSEDSEKDDDTTEKHDNIEHKETVFEVKGKKVPATQGHEALFNELFSSYAIVLSDSVLTCSGKHPSESLKDTMGKRIRKTFPYYTEDEVRQVQEKLITLAQNSELASREGVSRFVLENADYLYDVLPLTKMELRWLSTVLEDPLASVFLSNEQIYGLKKEIIQKVPPFPMEVINYFDRYNLEKKTLFGKKKISQTGRHTSRELRFIKMVYRAIQSEHRLKIKFRNQGGKIRYANCAAVWLEYSRRDDIFRICYINKKQNQVMKINVSRILHIHVLNDSYDKFMQRKKAIELYEKETRKIKVEFYEGKKNLPDRLLTEFSLWKKKCVYDIETKKYTMTLYYSESDKTEILIRLLGYGPYIRVKEESDPYILKEIKERIVRQKEKILENS